MGKCLNTECQTVLPDNVSYCEEHKFVSSTTTRNQGRPIPLDGGLRPPASAPASPREIPTGGNRGPGSRSGPSGGRGGSGGFGGGGSGGGF